ncbi:MAG: ABC transporter permease [Magnetococcales bacterium]|nr:ABC transporter permease [Magnetococcales bacterium]
MTEPDPARLSSVSMTVRRYSADAARRSPGALFSALISELWQAKELALRLFVRDLKQRYRQSVLGFLWLLLPPLATALVFVFLNSRKILNIDPTGIPYPVYVLLGTLLWQIFTESVLTPLKSFEACVPILIKINMSREAPILAGMAQVAVFAAVQLPLAFGTLLMFGMPLSWGMLLALPAILALMVMGTAAGLLLVPFGALFKDVGEGSAMALRFLFFLTPIVYPAPKEWPWSLVATLNPVSPLLQGARELFTSGALSDPLSFWIACFGGIVAFVLALIFYRLAIPVVLERMGA